MSQPTAVVGDIISANSRTLAPSSVAIQVGLMTGISILTVFVFNVLRPHNKIVYEPKIKYHVGEKSPPRVSDGFFGWFSPLIHTKENDLLDKAGLDAVAFLRFLRLCRWLFTAVAALTCGVLIPINVTYNLRDVDKGKRDILSMLTARDVKGKILFVHVAASYVITFLVMAFVWLHWKQMVLLRYKWFRSPEYTRSFYARTLMVQKVPKKCQSDEGIRAVFETVQVPYPTTAVHIGRRVGRLPDLIEHHNHTVRKLEEVLVRYLKDGKIGKQRPMLRRGGFLGMGGQKVDAIDFYTDKLKQVEAEINAYRQQIDTRKAENYGFASMAAVPYAHIVAQMLSNKRPRGTIITLAPNPKDIIWDNLNKSDVTIARKRLVGWFYLTLWCFLNTVPLLAVSFLANLSELRDLVGFIGTWATNSNSTFTIVAGVLPSAVSAAFGYFLPKVMRKLSRYQGATTRSRLDRAVVARYFAFLILSQLLIFTLIGVIFSAVTQVVALIGKHKSFTDIVQNLKTLPGTVDYTYINQANYWLTYFPLRGFLVIFDLAQIIHLVLIWIKTKLFGRTPRDIREWTQPPDFEYAIYYSNILFLAAVGMVFAPLAPLVAIAAAVVFWLSSFVYKYQLMFVFTTKVETGGRMWNVVINRLLVTVFFMQALMILTIGLQLGFSRPYYWISALPPMFIILIFKGYIDRKFSKPFKFYVPSDEELRIAQVHSQSADVRGNKLEKRFGHPALHAELFTPMLHSKMMPLLPEVYKGRLQSDAAVMDEYGGQKLDAQVVPGGIKIAAVSQHDLEYDPALYQRDRGELDWDQRSMASTNILSDGSSLHASKSQFYDGNRSQQQPSGYDQYLAHGPNSEIELSRFDSRPEEPLLSGQAGDVDQNYYQQSAPYGTPSNMSAATLPRYQTQQEANYSQQQQFIPQYPPTTQRGQQASDGYREAPTHRPSPSSRHPSGYSDGSGAGGNGNTAGRGAYAR